MWRLFLRWRAKRSQTFEQPLFSRFELALMFSLLLALVLTLSISDDDFWLPKERLVFKGESPLTGYVLRTSDEYVVVMKDRPRAIVERPKDSLLDRDFCYTDRPYHPASERMHANLPECP